MKQEVPSLARARGKKGEGSRALRYRSGMRIWMRLALTLCALTLAAGPLGAAPKKTTGKAAAAKKARAAQMRERGLAAIAAGREDEALEDFGLAVEANPNDQDARRSLMEAYEQKAMLFEMAMDRSLQ